MSWYAAHNILYVKLKNTSQSRFPVWENIVLVQADTEGEGFVKAERLGQEQAGDDGGSFRWGGAPAEWIFAGVRKLTLCDTTDDRPGDGSEISCTELELPSLDAVERLTAGEPVAVQYNDRYRAERVGG